MNHAEFETRWVEWGTSEYRTAHAKFKEATGRTIYGSPTFWVEGTDQSTTRTQLLSAGVAADGIIGWTIRTIGEFLFGRIKARREKRKADKAPADLGENAPLDDSPNPFRRTPIPEPAEDWEGVRLIAYAKTSTAIRLAGLLFEIKAKRGVRDFSKGKAELIIARDARRDALIEASGVEPKPIAILVMIPKTNQGLLKGIAIRKAETKFRDKFPDGVFVFEAIMERTDASDYDAVIAALRTPETVSAEAVEEEGTAVIRSLVTSLRTQHQEDSWFKWMMTSLLTILSVGTIWDRFKKSKLTSENSK